MFIFNCSQLRKLFKELQVAVKVIFTILFIISLFRDVNKLCHLDLFFHSSRNYSFVASIQKAKPDISNSTQTRLFYLHLYKDKEVNCVHCVCLPIMIVRQLNKLISLDSLLQGCYWVTKMDFCEPLSPHGTMIVYMYWQFSIFRDIPVLPQICMLFAQVTEAANTPNMTSMEQILASVKVNYQSIAVAAIVELALFVLKLCIIL